MFVLKGLFQPNYRWSIAINDDEAWLIKFVKTKHGKIIVEDLQSLDCGLEQKDVWLHIDELLGKGAVVSISFANRGFHYQQIALDCALSAREQRLFIEKQLSSQFKVQSSQILSSHSATVTNHEQVNALEVLATTKQYVQSFLSFMMQSKHRCLRLETMQLTLSWLARHQNKRSSNDCWGVLEFVSGCGFLIVVKGKQVICQRILTLTDAITDEQTKLTLLLQKVEQVKTLLGLSLVVNLFVHPCLFNQLTSINHNSSLLFTALTLDEYVAEPPSIILSSQLAFCALSIAYKTTVLN